jgi:hypothetical protein
MTTSWTYNKAFEKDGVLAIKNLWDPKELQTEMPDKKGRYEYIGDTIIYQDVEPQVNGSISRINYPHYRYIHSQIRLILEDLFGRKLYNTYYYDRFYFPGLDLVKHVDRPSCEISVSVNVSSTLGSDWAFWAETPNGTKSFNTNPGDGIIYKGCEIPHWREKMPTPWFKKDAYYHQIFFHYVLQDGVRAQFAWDMIK